MPSSATASRSSSLLASVRTSIEKMGTVDWLLAIALIVAIVTIVVWLYMHQNGDGVANAVMEEGFIDRGARGSANRAEMLELFTSGGAGVDIGDQKEPEALKSIKQLDEDVRADDLIVLLVHHNQCIHCKDFLPMWQRLCQKYQHVRQGDSHVTLYDISNGHDEALWSATSDRFGVEGYPTILFLKRKNGKVEHHEYMGPRDEYSLWCRNIERQCVA